MASVSANSSISLRRGGSVVTFEKNITLKHRATRQLGTHLQASRLQQPSLILRFLVGIMMLCSLKFLCGKLHPQKCGEMGL